MFTLSGKTALVTGASRGIGRAIAVEMAGAGARVAVHYNANAQAAKETVAAIEAAGGSAFSVQADLAEPGAADTLIDALASELRGDPLDILVNNAGIGAPGGIGAVSEADYDRVFAVNTKSPFFITRRALELIPDGGRIINIGSGVTRIAFPEGIAYAMAKGAVDTFTLALAAELGPRGITVNTVAPGIVDTDINASWLRGNAEAQAAAASRSALGRVGRPQDLTGPVLFLASAAGRWTTGQVIDATGGSHL
ncbi:SDR family NAD(P)-dependent oxidoreductase [Glycomyces algeriensis]|uniref:Oxidoreductase n=1 Tax=Glycomyces algeriensis TaxID=256037 RepID=A0A9W6G3S9_9ACTN|nr:SDR family oxidoreductase [Glycomyces algeriensis]MDA1366823.1 SDR family oxidoreductase [Glycomyces algeriensis]MDA1368933.1 SDR family oxidoreductase [Glycomyces algeriensis]MDR7352792.1 3-oxoacyl-[acyl-carrier protein] reductase [Glycomyces algeriensis]GLI40475.1 oxidoreductase [Glycomyces algeriensis]